MLRSSSSTMRPASFPPRASPGTRKPHVRGPCYYSDRLLVEQTRLIPGARRHAELGDVEIEIASLQTQSPAGGLEAALQQIGVRTVPLHPRSELALVEPATVGLAYQAEDVPGPERVVRRQPLGEDLLHLVRQAQQDVAGRARPGRRG